VPDYITHEAYSHEVSSCGFWPGDIEGLAEPIFYSYAYPEPARFRDMRVKPVGAYYHEGMGEFVLPYKKVARSSDPEGRLMAFFESTYEAAALSGHWDKDGLTRQAS
jgi:hypothetical protein